jgi:hypothetical protein
LQISGLQGSCKQVLDWEEAMGEGGERRLGFYGGQEGLMLWDLCAQQLDFPLSFRSGDFLLWDNLQQDECKAVYQRRKEEQP